MTEATESDLIKKNYTHGSTNLALTVNPANRQANLNVTVCGEVAASATVQEGRPIDKIVINQLDPGNLTLRLEARRVRITGTLEEDSVDHEVVIP